MTFSDVLGDQQFNLFASSVSQYRTFSGLLRQPQEPVPVRAAGLLADGVLLRRLPPGTLYDPGLGFLSTDDAIATRTMRGGTVFGIYPLNRYNRIEVFGGVVNYEEEYDNEALQFYADDYQQDSLRVPRCSATAWQVPLGASLVRETTIFREFGPLAGNSMRLTYMDARRRSATRSRTRPSTSTGATTCA